VPTNRLLRSNNFQKAAPLNPKPLSAAKNFQEAAPRDTKPPAAAKKFFKYGVSQRRAVFGSNIFFKGAALRAAKTVCAKKSISYRNKSRTVLPKLSKCDI